jgi:hypothetical protein
MVALTPVPPRCAPPRPRPARRRAPALAGGRRRFAASARVRPGQPLVGGQHAFLELAPLVLEAILLAGPRRGGHRVDREQEGEVGLEPTRGEGVDALDLVDPEAAGSSLVGERGVEKAVRDHDPPLREGRADHPGHELGTGGREQQRLRLGAERGGGVLEDLAHALANVGAARLAHPERLVAERVAEQPRLGGLAGAVDALEGHKQAAHARRP